jgi:predicted ArsR family transcriptional regulator
MPERHLDDNGFVIAHDAEHDCPPHLTAAARANCELCDNEGYRGTQVCDHIDRTETHAHGIAACRAVLTKGDDQ